LTFTVWPLKLKNILIWPTTCVNYNFTVVSLGLCTLKSNTNTNTERSFSETKPPETEREEEALISASYYSLWLDPLFCFFSLISLSFCCIFLYSTHKWREFIGIVIAPVILTAGNDSPFLIDHFRSNHFEFFVFFFYNWIMVILIEICEIWFVIMIYVLVYWPLVSAEIKLRMY